MTLLEQLQEKHHNAIDNNVYVSADIMNEGDGAIWAETSKEFKDAVDACTQITLQAIVDVLEGCIDEDFTRKTEGNVYAKIEELKLLIKK